MTDIKQVVVRSGLDLPDWRTTIERRGGRLAVVESAALKEQLYATERRPKEHDHPGLPGDPPVIVLDLHKTLTPSAGFLDTAEDTGLAPPFPGVKEALDSLVAGGCCLHIATAALQPKHSPGVLAARQAATQAWIVKHGLPISFVTGKVSAHIFYDDRMVRVPQDGDWGVVMDGILVGLDRRYERDKAGIWRRLDIREAGHTFEFPPPETILGDQPRPFSTPVLDVDMHRCLTQASSSKLDASPRPGAVEAMRAIYDAGYIIHLSCQGWDPTTHTPEDSAQRLAGMRQWCRQWGIPWDEFVSKDHGDPCFVDDKGVHHQDWADDLPILLDRLAIPHPEDEVTLRTLTA